jgi:E3 ubiquitin-protein ligase ATL6/9/15/31/42/55
MRILNYCTHSFHNTCIDTWFATHVTCPTCRHDIRNSS